MAKRVPKYFRNNDQWIEYVKELPALRVFRDHLLDQADYMSDKDRRYVLRVCAEMKRHLLDVEYGCVPLRHVHDYKEWNALRLLSDDAYLTGVTLAEYLEDFEQPQLVMDGLQNPSED